MNVENSQMLTGIKVHQWLWRITLILSSCIIGNSYAWAISLPSVTAQLPRQPEPLPIPESLPPPQDETPATPIIPQSDPTEIPSLPTQGIQVEKVMIVGSTAFDATTLATMTELEGKRVTEADLRAAVQEITQVYLNEGYLNSRASLESIQGGVVTIRVIEGTILPENVEIIGAGRLEKYVRDRLLLGIGTPLNVNKLEDQLRLLKNDPLLDDIQASLRPPTEATAQQGDNQSTLVVKVIEADPFFGSVGIDNYSPPSIGSERFLLNLGYRNVSGLGDRIYASYRPRLESFTGTWRLETGYEVPLNPMNGTLGVNALIERNKIIHGPPAGVEDLGIRGSSEQYSLDYRQPFIRTSREEFALSLGFRYYEGQTFRFDDIGTPFGFGPDAQGISRTSVLTFGQDYTSREPTGAWALRSQFRFGTGIFNATTNSNPIPDGLFFSWLLQGQRVQLLNPNNLLIIQADLQLAPQSLLASEQFVIGGAQSVRGYRQNLLAGDNGFRFSIEDRLTLVRNSEDVPIFILAPFFDAGVVWNVADNPNEIIADQTFIAGLGLGFIWQPIAGMNIRLDYAPPLVDVNTRGNNVQDEGFYFSINYDF